MLHVENLGRTSPNRDISFSNSVQIFVLAKNQFFTFNSLHVLSDHWLERFIKESYLVDKLHAPRDGIEA